MKKICTLGVLALSSLLAMTSCGKDKEPAASTPVPTVPAESTPTPSTPAQSTPAQSTPVSTPNQSVSAPTPSTPAEPAKSLLPAIAEGLTRFFFIDQSWWNNMGGATAIHLTKAEAEGENHEWPGVQMTHVKYDATAKSNLWYVDVDLAEYDTAEFVRAGLNDEKVLSDWGARTDKIALDAEHDTIVLAELAEHWYGEGNFCATVLGEVAVDDEAETITGTYTIGEEEATTVVWNMHVEEQPVDPNPVEKEGTTIYFVDSGWWNKDGAASSYYVYNAERNEAAWPGTKMEYVAGLNPSEGVYLNLWSCVVDTSVYTSLILVRVGGDDASDWGAKTVEITLPLESGNTVVVGDSAVWGDPGAPVTLVSTAEGEEGTLVTTIGEGETLVWTLTAAE